MFLTYAGSERKHPNTRTAEACFSLMQALRESVQTRAMRAMRAENSNDVREEEPHDAKDMRVSQRYHCRCTQSGAKLNTQYMLACFRTRKTAEYRIYATICPNHSLLTSVREPRIPPYTGKKPCSANKARTFSGQVSVRA